jgi:plastocyanin
MLRRTPIAIAGIATALALAAAACSGSDGAARSQAAGPTLPRATAEATRIVPAVPTPVAIGSAEVAVDVVENRFWPPAVQVKAGATVVWTFDGETAHAVKAVPAAGVAFDSGGRVSGEFAFEFSTPGTYWYYCSIHPGMVGRVVVAQ